MNILAIDLGKFNSMCCILDTKSQEHSFLNAAKTREDMTTVFRKHTIDLVVMEACDEPSSLPGYDVSTQLPSRRTCLPKVSPALL